MAQGDDEFDGSNNKFKEAHADENVFDAARAEESLARARSQRAIKMAAYATGLTNNPKEEEEEENS